MSEEMNRELKDLAIRECKQIPSNSKILYDSAEVSHTIRRKRGKLPLEKHIIMIEWVQIQEQAESEDKE